MLVPDFWDLSRAVRPVFRHRPVYLNISNNELLFFHTINIYSFADYVDFDAKYCIY